MSNDLFISDEDQAQAARYTSLGPAYFAARRAAEKLFQGDESLEVGKVADEVTKKLRDALYEYLENQIQYDLQDNLQYYIHGMVDDTVRALLTGKEWALKRYPLAQSHDGDEVRKAIASYCGDEILKQRIATLEAEVKRLNETLQFHYGH